MIVAVAVLAAGGRLIVKLRLDTWTQASQASENLRLALSRDIARNLGVYDRSLREVIDSLAEPGIDQVSPGIRRHALFDTLASAEDLGSILVVDATGHVVEGSTPPPLDPMVESGRDYFGVQRDRADAGLVISRPYRDSPPRGELRISLSRRRSTPDGRFDGIVEAALRLSSFERLFSQLDIGPKGTITLLRDDGYVLARHPFVEKDIGQNLSRSEGFRHLSSADQGQFVAYAAIDGVERLYTYGRLPDLPLILSVGRATEDILAPWRHRALMITPVLLLLFMAAVTSSLLFRREIGRRIAVEALLREAAEELSSLATVDGLTGIANRRAFDIALDVEWRRAIRDHTSLLSILMIDVDWFKAFNDHFGHQDGDRALKAIAGTLSTAVGRAADLVARFGGEEFIALLPDTDREGAMAIVERMRAAVVDLDLGHPGSPQGCITVSIGVASRRPFGGDLSSDLIAAADAALYAAKRGGRNHVRSDEAERLDAAV